MQRILSTVAKTESKTEISHVRVFAQLYALEPRARLQEILNMRFFYPRVITITIRHTDWWFWESDNNLHFDARWVGVCKFPNSLAELRVAFESLERKKDQIDDVAAQAMESWSFCRFDGTLMSASDCVPEIMRWSGAATWGGRRWLRDETGPNKLDYYVSTITWRPVKASVNREELSSQADVLGKLPTFPNLDAVDYPRVSHPLNSVWVHMLERAGIPPDAPTEVARRVMEDSIGLHDEDDEDENEDENGDEEEDDDDEDGDYYDEESEEDLDGDTSMARGYEGDDPGADL